MDKYSHTSVEENLPPSQPLHIYSQIYTMNSLTLYLVITISSFVALCLIGSTLYACYLGPRFLWVLPGRHLVLDYRYLRDEVYTIEGRVLASLPDCLYLLNRHWHVLRLETIKIKAIANWSWRKDAYQPYMDSIRVSLPRDLLSKSTPIQAPEAAHLNSKPPPTCCLSDY